MDTKNIVVTLTLISVVAATLPTNYEYYTDGGIKSGLSVDQKYFTLNGKNITIYSGAMHYFRVPRAYWRDRLRKIRAAGLNAVETYIAWNLHEPQSGVYDWGNGNNYMTDFLHIEEFIKTAQEEDLFVIIRPSPYIDSEYEFGGFPSWILREKDNLKVRTSDPVYMKYVSRWYNQLMPKLEKYQFSKGTGPIIAMQVENEYAYFNSIDKNYLRQLKQLMIDNGIVELLTTADGPWNKASGTIPELFFMTGDFGSDAKQQFDLLEDIQPGKPKMVMEYYTGGSDTWGTAHNGHKDVTAFKNVLENVLSYPGSFNIYMFHGGTSYGFMNGGTTSNNDEYNSGFSGGKVNSYDFDGCLKEDGDYGEKYYVVKDLVAKYRTIQTKTPDMPKLIPRKAYPTINITQEITFNNLLKNLAYIQNEKVVNMEELDINNNSGQSYGYIIYRKSNLNLKANSILKIIGRVCDSVIVLVNGKRVSPILKTAADLENYGTWKTANSSLVLNNDELFNVTLDLFVENWGRINFGLFKQYKGLWQGDVLINEKAVYGWTIYPLEFKPSWTNSLKDWTNLVASEVDDAPKLYKANLQIENVNQDTYVHMENWINGIVIVNGFVLGRYRHMGCQQTLYLPGPFLKNGSNDIIIFEHFNPFGKVEFVTDPIYALH